MSFDAAGQKIFFAMAGDFSTTPFTVIGEHGNGPTINVVGKIVKTMLTKLSENPNRTFRTSYTQGDLLYHVKQTDRYAYICVTGKDCKIRIPFTYLDDLEAQHLRTQSKNLSTIMRERMAYHNENDKITKIKDQVEQVKGQMVENIDKILDRGEKLDDLIVKTDDLTQNAFAFKGKSKTLKNKVIIAAVILTILLIIIFLFIFLIIAIIIVAAICTNIDGKCLPQSQQQKK